MKAWGWVLFAGTLAFSSLASAQVTSTSIALAWTAPGDDSLTGTATSYELRYSTTAITSLATYLTGTLVIVPAPHIAGTAETITVAGLSPSTAYWFALRTRDEVGNVSELSNIATATTLAPPDTLPPAAITTLRVRP